jgi:hypothetical protein
MFSLTDLEEVLAAVSHGNRRWSYAMAHDYARMNRNYVTITYSNPIYGSLPNAISYHFPVVRSSTRHSPDTMYVCMHPELAELGQCGLYFEGGRVLGDVLYDWDVFWSPIHKLLASSKGGAPDEDAAVAPQDYPWPQK